MKLLQKWLPFHTFSLARLHNQQFVQVFSQPIDLLANDLLWRSKVQKEVDVFIWAETCISRRWSSISDHCQWQGNISAPHHYWRKVFSICFFFPGCSATTESFTSVNAANILFWVILIFSLVKSWFIVTFLQMVIIKLCSVVYVSGVGSRLKLQ